MDLRGDERGVDGELGGVAAQHRQHLRDDLLGHLRLGLHGGGAEVRRGDDPGVGHQRVLLRRLLAEDVQGRAGHTPVLDGGEQRRLVDEAAAGHVQEPDALLDTRQLPGAQQAASTLHQGGVYGEEVALLQQLVHCRKLNALAGGALRGDEGVERDDAHVQAEGPAGHLGADATEADDAQDLAPDLHAHEVAATPLAALEGGVRLGDVAGEGEDKGNGVLGGGHGVARGGVDDGDAASCGGFQVDVVDAHAGSAHDLEVRPGFQDVGGDLGVAADDEGFAVGDAVEELRRG